MKGEEQEARGDCKIDEVLSRLAYYLTFPPFLSKVVEEDVTFARAARLKRDEFSRRSR